MLIIRVGLASNHSLPSALGGGTGASAGGPTGGASRSWPASSGLSGSRGGVRRRTDGSYVMQDLKVEITQVVEDDSGYRARDGGSGALKRADASPGGTGSRSDGASAFESDRDSGEFVALSFAPAGARGSTAEREYTV